MAQLLAAALPADLVYTCDLSAETAAAACCAASCDQLAASSLPSRGPQQQLHQQAQQQQQSRSHALQIPGTTASGKGSHAEVAGSSGDPSSGQPARHGSLGSNQPQAGTPAGAPPAAGAATAGAGKLLRASDTGLTSLSSPKPASWFEYIFPWQGTASVGNSPRHLQLSAEGSKTGASTPAGDSEGVAAGAVRLPSGAWAATVAPGDGVGSPNKGVGGTNRRATTEARSAGGVECLQHRPCQTLQSPICVGSQYEHW